MADQAMRAVGWSFASSALGKLATVVIGVMLARMLSPRDFGVYAVAYAALRILVSLNDLGLSLAVVRWPGDPSEVTPTVATIAAVLGMVIYGACYVGAPSYASAMGAPAAAGVVRVLCLGVVLDGFISSPAGLLQRNFRQDLRLVTDQVNLWLGTIVTIVLAWQGFGAMSLGIGRVIACLASLVLMIRFSPEPLRFGFSLARARDVLRFGLPVAASTIISFGVVNADQVVVGRLLGVTALGYFVLAANLSSWPVAVFAQPVRNVALAGFARLQHDPPAMRRAFLLVAGLLTAVALPVCLMMSGAAVPLVGLIYGHRWLAAAPILGWLGILASLQIAFELSYDYFVVLALPRVVFILQLVWLIALVPVLAAGSRAGATGVVQAEIVVAASVVLPWYLGELRKTGIRASVLARRLRFPAVGAAAAGLSCWAAGRLVPGQLAALVIGVAAGTLIIALLVHRLRPALELLRGSPSQPASQPAGTAVAEVTGPAGTAVAEVTGPAGTAVAEVTGPAGAAAPAGAVHAEAISPDGMVLAEAAAPAGTVRVTAITAGGTVLAEAVSPAGTVLAETISPAGTVLAETISPAGTVLAETVSPAGTILAEAEARPTVVAAEHGLSPNSGNGHKSPPQALVVPPPPEPGVSLPPLYRATAAALGWVPSAPECQCGQGYRNEGDRPDGPACSHRPEHSARPGDANGSRPGDGSGDAGGRANPDR